MNSTMELLKRKFAGIPYWLWGLLAIAALAFVLYRRKQSAAAAAAAAAAANPNAASSSNTTGGVVSGDTGIDEGTAQYWGGWPTTPVTTTPVITQPTPGQPTPVTTAPLTPIKQGQGYFYGMGNETPVQSSTGAWYMWESPQFAAANPTAKRYVWSALPNTFVPAVGVLAPGTPQFIVSGPPSVAAAPQSGAPLQAVGQAIGALAAAA